MSATRKVLLAAAAAIALAAPVIAADGGREDGVAWVLDPSGATMQQMRFSPEGLTAFMRHNPKAVSTRMFIVRSGGKTYMLDDPTGSLYTQFRDMMIGGGS